MKLSIEYVPIEKILPYKKNAKLHPKEQIKQIENSIEQFGFNDPIALWKNEIVEGHGRFEAAKNLGLKELPVIRLDDLTNEQRKAYMLVHNKLTMNTDFDIDLLNAELSEIFSFDMAEFGFDFDEQKEQEPIEDNFVNELKAEPKTKIGDVYLLGKHRLCCGDSTNEADVQKLMNGKKASLVFTDPPYGMNKEIENDELNSDELLNFNKKWVPLSFKYSTDNCSWYCWGIDESLLDIYSEILRPMIKRKEISFRNFLTWDKKTAIAGGTSLLGKDGLRSYPTSSEKCLFVMAGIQDFSFSINQEDYFDGWEPIRNYLLKEAEKVKLTSKKLHEICGVGMFSHWFSKSQWNFIGEKYYEMLQKEFQPIAFNRSYEELKQEFERIKDEFEHSEQKKELDRKREEILSSRAFFDNTHDYMRDVWVFNRTQPNEYVGHPTQKPIEVCCRGIKTSSRENDIVLDLFAGSGSTLIACEQLNRSCYAMELEPRWCDVIVERWEAFTGKKAERT